MLPYEQDRARLARLLASCDALIHAGRHETFGMILVEAMACGLPVIAVRSGAVTEIVDAQIGRIATPDDARSLADAVRSIFAGGPRRDGRIRARARRARLSLGEHAAATRRALRRSRAREGACARSAPERDEIAEAT